MNSTHLHQQAIVVDGHCDTLLRFQAQESGRPPGFGVPQDTKGHIDLALRLYNAILAQRSPDEVHVGSPSAMQS